MPSHDDFDGYRKWLNITSPRRPPTHYELLGVKLDEDDHEVIQAAIEQRRNFVASKRGTGYDNLVAEILMRIDEAGITLLNSEMRREYDRQMDLFENRKKARRVDPLAPQSRITSRPGRTVGEDNGIVKTFAGIAAVLCIAFAGMACFAFNVLPWSKQSEKFQALPAAQGIEPAQVAEAPAPVAPKAPEKSNEQQKNDATAKVIKAIQGEWFIFSSEIQGKPFDSKKAHVIIDGNTMKGGDGTIVNDFVLDASNGYFDYSLRKKNGNLKDAIGIYEFDGETLKTCYRYNVDGTAQRPTEFKTDDGKPNVMVFHTFKRVEARNDGEDATAQRSLTEKNDDSGDLKSMQGEWTAIEEELNGKTFDQKAVSIIARHMSVKGNSLLISQMWADKIGDRLTSHTGDFRIDQATHAFDFFAKASNEANVEFRGIYKLDGDMLTLCYKYAKDFTTPRPTEFRTDADSGTVFAKTVFRRDASKP